MTSKKMPAAEKPKDLQVNVRLTGKDAERFLRYKEAQRLKTVAATTYKLIFERLDQIEAAA
jgi:uncharacterized beta-barrel protein YwiB (DUF1934 family)